MTPPEQSEQLLSRQDDSQRQFMQAPQVDYNQMFSDELMHDVPGMNEFEIDNLDEILECGDDLMDIE